jgi:hypothetical protein
LRTYLEKQQSVNDSDSARNGCYGAIQAWPGFYGEGPLRDCACQKKLEVAFSQCSQSWCAREDLNLFRTYVSFRDSGFASINPSDSSCPQNLLDEDFCAAMQFSCHHLSSKKDGGS